MVFVFFDFYVFSYDSTTCFFLVCRETAEGVCDPLVSICSLCGIHVGETGVCVWLGFPPVGFHLCSKHRRAVFVHDSNIAKISARSRDLSEGDVPPKILKSCGGGSVS